MFVTLAILATGALVFLSAAVQHLNTITANGIAFAFTDRSTPLSREGFTGRAARVLQNNLESAAMFLPAALLLSTNGSTIPDHANIAAGVYVIVRIAFTLAYWTGHNHLRSLFWGLGMASIMVVTLTALLTLLT
ncbi:MAPEG family protein [Pelagibacterium lentulum]|uniref:MAPEG family protein n=1 Tax=Pelagibacterium lentulum TaxID=2029865 RepID=A0A916RBY7_9HYPH|nr:MAPEG family protein [Pelagibacterium lentulum]GGA45343.1 hypothetical protein GCM10011499_13810 [Pelagibacterium lentulum]